jgi:hypothetical protein
MTAAAAAAVALFFGVAAPAFAGGGFGMAQADTAGVQKQVDNVLAKSPGGKQISANQVAWNDGKVVLTIPLAGERSARAAGEPVTTLGTANCPYTWTCLYEHANFDGRRLQFSACGYIQDLGAYGFSDMATSWHNNQTPGTRTWVYNWTGSWTQIWVEGGAPSKSTNVGAGNNDRADGIRAC